MSAAAPIAFSVQMAEADLVCAFRLHANIGRVRPLLLTVVLLVMVLALIFAASPAARWSATTRPTTLLLEGAVLIMLVLVTALFAALPWLWRRMARRTMAQRADLSGPVHYELTPELLVQSTPYNTARLPWAAFTGWRENERLLMLYLSDQLFHALPKAQVPAAGLTLIRTSLSAANVRCLHANLPPSP